MKTKSLLCVGMIALTTSISSVKADCQINKWQIAQTIKDMCYECMFPFYFAGQYIAKGSMPDVRGRALGSNIICSCYWGSFWTFGLPMGYFEASRSIDVVKDPTAL